MSEGPYLTAAIICERVIEGKDNVISIMRMMDSIILDLPEGTPDDFPSEESRLSVAFDHFVCVKTGRAPGPHTVRLDMISPSGKTNEGQTVDFVLPPEEHGGANLTLHQTVHVFRGGLFYFHVFLDDQLATRVPFRIDLRRGGVIQPTSAEGPGPTKATAPVE